MFAKIKDNVQAQWVFALRIDRARLRYSVQYPVESSIGPLLCPVTAAVISRASTSGPPQMDHNNSNDNDNRKAERERKLSLALKQRHS